MGNIRIIYQINVGPMHLMQVLPSTIEELHFPYCRALRDRGKRFLCAYPSPAPARSHISRIKFSAVALLLSSLVPGCAPPKKRIRAFWPVRSAHFLWLDDGQKPMSAHLSRGIMTVITCKSSRRKAANVSARASRWISCAAAARVSHCERGAHVRPMQSGRNLPFPERFLVFWPPAANELIDSLWGPSTQSIGQTAARPDANPAGRRPNLKPFD